MRINHNIAALNTYRQLTTNTGAGAKSLEKLSSGLRINRAGDDAAGLAISEKMRAQIRGLTQAQRNAQDGISMIQTTEGALNEAHSILQRMRELSAQAANDTNVAIDREEIQKEVNQLTSEINRIGNTTEFNTQSLLKGKNVAVVETAAVTKTITDGVKGVAVGELSTLNVVKSSVKAESSSASVQGQTSKATGKVSEVTENTESVAGVKSSVNLSVGLSVNASEFGTDLNGKEITVRQGTVANEASRLEIDGQGNYTFTIGQTAGGASRATNLGTLYNEMKSSIDNYDSTTGFTSTNAISVSEPPSQNTSQPVTLTQAGETGELEGGVAEVNGVYEFEITDAFEEAGDTITVGGQTFKAVLSGADASKGEFNIGNIEATLTAGQSAVAGEDLTGIAADATVDISIGGTTYTVSNANLKQIGDGAIDFGAADKSVAEYVGALKTATSSGGKAITDVADIAVNSAGKIVITAKDPQTQPISIDASSSVAADVRLINDAFGINTSARIGGAANNNAAAAGASVSVADDLNGRVAEWSAKITTLGVDTDSNTFTFNGVTVTVDFDSTHGSHEVVAGSVTSTAATIKMDTDAAGFTKDALAGLLEDAFKAVQSTTGSNLDDFVFDSASDTFTIKTTSGTDNYNANNLTLGGDVTLDFQDAAANSYFVGGAVAAAADTAGADAIDEDTKITITVDGKNFSISNTQLKTLDNGYVKGDLKTLIENATDENGYTLSSYADVELVGMATDELQITSKGGQPNSSIQFSISAGTTADLGRLETVFGIDNFVSDTGADTVSSSRSVEDQAKSLAAAVEANSTLGGRFEYATVSGGKITLTETNNKASGATLSDTSVSGSGADDKLVVTNAAGQNLNTISITRAQDTASEAAKATVQSNGHTLDISGGTTGSQATRANGVKVELNSNTTDTLNVSFKDGVLSVNLANTTKANNTEAKIEAAIQNLGTIDGIDFSAWQATASGGWDAGNDATDIEVANASLSGGVAAVAENALNVTVDGGNLTLHLSAESVKENTASKVQSAVQDLGEYFSFDASGNWTATDFSQYTFEAKGNWDTATLGNSIIKDADTFVGGTKAVEGSYTVDVSKAFAAGDKVEVNGQVFTAVDGIASASKGQFSTSGALKDQAASLMSALNLNSAVSAKYTAAVNGTTITLTEKTATGDDLSNDDIDVRATGTPGEFSVDQSALLENGAKFIVDGEEISISSANQHVGYSNGTAVKVSETVADQTKALADAINSNANLKNKYTASVGTDGALKLTQSDDFTSSTAPEVSTKNSSKGDFQATFQIGANSGQSMTITVGDMRANALGISGDGSVATTAASNGYVASYTAVSTVNNGSNNTNVEFALDVTTSEKASAALSVINDAIERVSSQRSQLGAFQNRLDHTINNLGTSAENLVASESRIRDVDMAAEMMDFTKNNILSQAAQAMLAQANQLPQGVLQLLR